MSRTDISGRVGDLERRVDHIDAGLDADMTGKRLDGMEARFTAMNDRATEHREQIAKEIHEVRMLLAVGEQDHKATLAKVESIAKDVKTLMESAQLDRGKHAAWAPIIDSVWKVVTALVIGWLALKYGLK